MTLMEVDHVEETLPTQPEAEFDIQAAIRLILDNQQVMLQNQKVIMENQAVLAKRIYDVKAGVREIYRQQPSIGNAPEASAKTTMIDFEKNPRCEISKGLSYRNIALQIENKLVDTNLWSSTAWSGGRPIGVPLAEGGPSNQNQLPKEKFSFVEHIGSRSFFSDAVKETCGSAIPDNEISRFVQSRRRNSKYVRSNRTVSARRRAVQQTTESEGNGSDTVAHEGQLETQ